MARRTRIFRDEDGEHQVVVADDGRVIVDGSEPLQIAERPDGAVRVGDNPAVTAWVAGDGGVRWVFIEGEVYRFEIAKDGRRRPASAHHGSLSAPMPATVLKVRVSPGEDVAAGATLLILEAMKMELPVRAPAAGKVTAVNCREGDLVQPGVSLIEME
jgi:biotin carboxyl carrier protein